MDAGVARDKTSDAIKFRRSKEFISDFNLV